MEASQTPNAKLVFRKYHDLYFPAEVWGGQSNIGIAFSPSKREKELQAANTIATQPEVVA